MTEPLEHLLRGRVAYGVMRALSRDLTMQLRMNGQPIPPWAPSLLASLEEAAGERLPESVMAAIGRPVVMVDPTTWTTVHRASEITGRSERHIRRLAAAGRIRARRVGPRTWQIDLDSLQSVLRRTR